MIVGVSVCMYVIKDEQNQTKTNKAYIDIHKKKNNLYIGLRQIQHYLRLRDD